MVQKSSYLIPADKCGVWWVSVFQIYKGSFKKIAYLGGFVKVSVKLTRPQNWLKKKTKLKGMLIRSKKELSKIDGSSVKFFCNNVILFKKRTTPMGKEIYGPTVKDLKRKKFINSFPGVM
jgi:large subunit ribosomal protein L14